MKTIGIREMSGELIKKVTDQGQVIGITSGRVLAGVLMPIGPEIVEQLVDRNLARIKDSVRRGEEDVAAGRGESLQDLMGSPPEQGGYSRVPPQVSIRQLSGSRIQQAADSGEALIVTHDGAAVALLIPVTSHWVERLVERNLPRIRNSIERGENEIAQKGILPTLEELLEEPEQSHPGSRPVRHDYESLPSAGRSLLEGADSAVAAMAVWAGTITPPSASLMQQRVVGIKIIPDAQDERIRLVGVLTDALARIVRGPVELPLANLDQGTVLAGVLDLVQGLEGTMKPGGEHLVAVGMELGGHVHNGTVVYSANAGWHHFPLASLVQRQLSIPVTLENDANALAIRERLSGIKDENMVVILITNRGVGSGVIANGQIVRGANGMAGELGHVPVEFERHGAQVKCRCENPGCLEGATAPYAIMNTLTEDGFNGDFDAAVEAANEAGSRAHEVFLHAGEALGRAIATVINLHNPSSIVLYGPPALVGEPRDLPSPSGFLNQESASLYMGAMIRSINNHSFSTGVDDCRFIVRNTTDADGAAAAAACVLQQLPPLRTAPSTTTAVDLAAIQ
ncbi:hypothetical protein [Streptomyces afghaniensis 772] [Streptomyces afghaniensis]|nr:ROK family protein [Streptomyces afghaniensis]